jgi:hypothetical protein
MLKVSISSASKNAAGCLQRPVGVVIMLKTSKTDGCHIDPGFGLDNPTMS